MSIYDDTINLFNVVVLNGNQANQQIHIDLSNGYVTDFIPDMAQQVALANKFKPIDVTTLFFKEERLNASIDHLITKQIMHYIEVYGLDSPGLFNLEVSDGKIVTLNFVKGISKEDLAEKVRTLLYSNAPVKDVEPIKNMVIEYGIHFDINEVKNNELRVVLFNANTMKYGNGDDAVRYICYKSTGSALLIKSPAVISQVKIDTAFLENHAFVLSQVFNRHKRIIMALKNSENKTVINKISRLSKKNHVPVHESIAKRLISEYVNHRISDMATNQVLGNISVRDKFKYLNLLQYKRQQNDMDAFVIRNGKIHIQKDRPALNLQQIESLEKLILTSLGKDLSSLRGKNILLDKKVDYGLPISRKQVLGNLPFGTEVSVDGNEICSGVHWRNEWGASDLDLSAIDVAGGRVGWGRMSGYDDRDIIFSGDVTSAPDGAMEFMTSKVGYKKTYGLFLTVFHGQADSKYEVVVGSGGKRNWISDVVLREKVSSEGKNGIIGFVKDGKFIVYKSLSSSSYISGSEKDKALIQRGTSGFWTVSELLFELGIAFDVDKNSEKTYDYDMSYNQFSYDKLEDLLINTK